MLDFHELVAAAGADGPLVHETSGPLPEVPADLAPAAAVRRLSGARMADLESLYDETSAALQFPDYFGRNLDAFDESLRDLDLPEAPGGTVILVITDAAHMLAREPHRRPWFGEAVADANEVRAGRGMGPLVVVFSSPSGSDPAAVPWFHDQVRDRRTPGP